MPSPTADPKPASAEIICTQAAVAAGNVLIQDRKSPPEVDRFYAHDIKLAADRNAERAILDILNAEDPEAEIHTEEAGDFAAVQTMCGISIHWMGP